MATLIEKQLGVSTPVWEMQTASANQIDACCGLGRGINLLDDWYFVGGGSQQGGGQFPINQKGLNKYTSAGYTIDRWYSRNVLFINLESDGLHITSDGLHSLKAFNQRFENYKFLLGKTVTLSALITENTVIGENAILEVVAADTSGLNSDALVQTKIAGKTGLVTVTGQIPKTINRSGINIGIYFGYNNDTVFNIKIKAIKLELGPFQTLAHQDSSGNWVLNDPPPNFQQELAKCKYFQQGLKALNNNITLGFGRLISDKNIAVSLPIGPMRTSPASITNPTGVIASKGTFGETTYPVTGVSFIGYRPGDSLITALFACPTGTVGEIYRVGLLIGNELIFDSNL